MADREGEIEREGWRDREIECMVDRDRDRDKEGLDREINRFGHSL